MKAFAQSARTLSLIWLAGVLAACSPATATSVPAAPTDSPAAATAAPTQAPAAATSAPTATDLPAPTDSPAAASGIVVYVIDPTKTTASYSVDETFINQNNKLNTAVGTTQQVTGQLKLNLADPAKSELGTFTVDLSTLTSDSRRRDQSIRENWLESVRFPNATFVAHAVTDFPANPQTGQVIPFKLAGDLTVHQVTKPVTWEVTAMLKDNVLSGQAKTFIKMADFGVQPPSLGGILNVTDGVSVTLDFVMRPTQ